MRPHKEPDFRYDVRVDYERDRIRAWQQQPGREIPEGGDENLLIATWNLTNFGLQKRKQEHIQIMAEILRPFHVVALQEIADDLSHLNDLIVALGAGWEVFYTDIAGNRERLAYLYREPVKPTGLAAELALRSFERQRILIEEVSEVFEGFNRNPYMLGFRANGFTFTLVNVHLYWTSIGLRQLEAKALSGWAEGRAKKDYPPNDDIILIGDFNMPSFDEDDEIFKILKRNGLELPKHRTNLVGSNLAGDNHYDEIAFFPRRTRQDFTGRMGVYDFDGALFDDLWSDDDKEQRKRFYQYLRYYIADHRPMWAEFRR